MPNDLTFYAVTREGVSPLALQRIRLEQNVQQQLSALFDEQAAELRGEEVEPIDYTPSYPHLEKHEVFSVSDFEIPEFLAEALSAPEGVVELQVPFTPEAPRVKAIVGVDSSADAFYFQYFERRRILDRQRVLIFRGDTFNALSDPAVCVDNKLAAVIVDGELRFRSFHITRQFLDLSLLFDDASEESVRAVLTHNKLHIDDPSTLNGQLSSRIKRRIALVVASGILDDPKVTPQLIQSRAKRYSDLDEIRLRGASNARKLVLPTELRKLEKLLRFLSEELYVGDLTGDERVSSSSRVLVSATS